MRNVTAQRDCGHAMAVEAVQTNLCAQLGRHRLKADAGFPSIPAELGVASV